MRIKWHYEKHNTFVQLALLNTEQLGYVKHLEDGTFKWRITMLDEHYDYEGTATTEKKAKDILSKTWWQFMKCCGYRPPAPRRRNTRWCY